MCDHEREKERTRERKREEEREEEREGEREKKVERERGERERERERLWQTSAPVCVVSLSVFLLFCPSPPYISVRQTVPGAPSPQLVANLFLSSFGICSFLFGKLCWSCIR